jgi:hypothetical protein
LCDYFLADKAGAIEKNMTENIEINDRFYNMHFDLILIPNELFFILNEQSKKGLRKVKKGGFTMTLKGSNWTSEADPHRFSRLDRTETSSASSMLREFQIHLRCMAII